MERNSLSLKSSGTAKSAADILRMSQALNNSVEQYHPLILCFILSFDEIVHNMKIFFKLSSLVKNEEARELSYKDLFLYCKENGVIKGTLSEWMFYQCLRKKIKPGMDMQTVREIIKAAPKFVGEINYMVDGLERELRKYRTLN